MSLATGKLLNLKLCRVLGPEGGIVFRSHFSTPGAHVFDEVGADVLDRGVEGGLRLGGDDEDVHFAHAGIVAVDVRVDKGREFRLQEGFELDHGVVVHEVGEGELEDELVFHGREPVNGS